jgi:hypothetical protein
VLEAAFILLEFPSPSRKNFIGSHSLPPLWFAVSVLQREASNTGEAKIKVVRKHFRLTFVFNALNIPINLYLNSL